MVIPIRDENPTRRTPYLTLAVLVANVAVFFFVQPTSFEARQSLTAAAEEQRFFYEHAAVPCEVTTLEPLTIAQLQTGECEPRLLADDGIGSLQPFPDKSVLLSILASMFLHGGLLHLGGNMLFLWIFGNNVEERTGIVGYAFFYAVCGVAATLAHVLTQPDSVVPLVGASGAIAGVMGAYLVWFPRARILSIVPIFFLIQVVRLPAGVVLGIWFVMQFFTNPNSAVAWAAHVGGFLAGALLAWLFGGQRPQPAPAPPTQGWG